MTYRNNPPRVHEGLRITKAWPSGGDPHCFGYVFSEERSRQEWAHYVFSMCREGCSRHTVQSGIVFYDRVYNPATRRHDTVHRPQFYKGSNVRLQISNVEWVYKLSRSDVDKLKQNIDAHNRWWRRALDTSVAKLMGGHSYKHVLQNFG